jgi:uncharacterized protein (TIGR03435 family)
MVEERYMQLGCPASILVFCSCAAWGQSADPAPAFEVASVKATPQAVQGPEMGRKTDTITPSPGGLTMLNVRLKSAVQWAYHLQPIQVSGPGWIESNRYDIVAKTSGPVTTEQLRRMTQTLLADRFKLAVHKETKEMAAYVVTVGKNGHKLKPSEGEGEMQLKPGPNRMVAQFTHVTLAQLAEMTSSPLQGVVVDETGLKGQWDFTLDVSNMGMTQPTGIDDAINMIIQVLNEQLGIKVDQKRVPAELLIVDHAEKIPVEN